MANEYGFRRAREKAGLSLAEAAKALGISRQAVNYWETGQKNPSLPRLLQLAELYKTNLDGLVKGSDENV